MLYIGPNRVQMERLALDEEHFLQAAGVAGLIKVAPPPPAFQGGVQINSQLHSASSCREAKFWASIPPSTIEQLQASWAYGPDFRLFQYSAQVGAPCPVECPGLLDSHHRQVPRTHQPLGSNQPQLRTFPRIS